MNIKILLGSVLLSSALLTACSIPYKIDIEQGNEISAEQIGSLDIGMRKEEVKIAIGSPVLEDSFNQNRWDYIQHYKSAKGKDIQKSTVSLFFTNDLLIRIDAKEIVDIEKDKISY